jgi:hypothetical protein
MDSKRNQLEPPCTDPYARWCGRGRRVTAAPMPISSVNRKSGSVVGLYSVVIGASTTLQHMKGVYETGRLKSLPITSFASYTHANLSSCFADSTAYRVHCTGHFDYFIRCRRTKQLFLLASHVLRQLHRSLRSLDCFRCSLHDSDKYFTAPFNTSQTRTDALPPTLDTLIWFREGDKFPWALFHDDRQLMLSSPFATRLFLYSNSELDESD